ncbi:UDP-N-acetylglucosamine 2-epimerase (non-hydrolyzing) [Paenibacillus psychroresistens]|uniref:UDP-N-acetylglucosamine 2-epimerase (Non-hydrolyzing) n=1 Tax=Paenibacillus psychroresistens TaxID=1778678 RepID=A0A6B8RL76_9BACL|nr:UDP-N-acetylglucosamine 2-epimerase (non-hydrolyzing) [Paenibacillus psychroresistens]QGQ96514.1 UDP-N-acetylglucosamine 2-epimerase (non-hydrolyzing) [Paenibacillus psychroresistens]
MKIATILGTRPEIIRLSLILNKLNLYADHPILIHTGQNYTHSLNRLFFQEMQLRDPDYLLNDQFQSLGGQLSMMFREIEKILLQEKPDKVLVLGDTNSALSAILAERMGIPVIHMEAGNRCFNLEVPEEKNRKVIDAISSYNLPYTKQSKENLLSEGVPVQRIILTGNPIYEVLQHYQPQIDSSTLLNKLNLKARSYFLVTAHRSENVDHPQRLQEIINGLNLIAELYQLRLIFSVHPRTRARIEQNLSTTIHPLIEFHEPFGFFDFAHLEKHALCVLTDSGTVQEECCIYHVPTVTMRNSTERPETVDCGSNIVAGIGGIQILAATKLMVQLPTDWCCPEGYLDTNVSDKVIKFLLGGKCDV